MTVKNLVKKIVPKWALAVYHWKLAFLGALLFGFPSRKLKVIGVTGTSGKSTTVDFISRIFEENGDKTASASTARFKICNKEWENKYKMTMPGRFVLQKFLRRAVREGCKYAVLEVTSEGVRQSRHKFIRFDTAVFTNLTPEHIESHGGFENYRNTKLDFFKYVKNIHVINGDDKNAQYFIDIPAKKKFIFSLKDINKYFFTLDLLGEFNVMNALAAIHAVKAYDVNFAVCKRALGEVKSIPGRMEVVAREPFKVVVDYAHTPEQLENVYKALKGSGKLVCVLGSCGGGRDKWKRPVLGKIAEQYCDQIIITNEDPYDEDPSQILSEIKSGILSAENFYEILDRKEATQKALQLAKPGDTVVITGKGSEPWMCVANGKKIPWSDKENVLLLLKELK